VKPGLLASGKWHMGALFLASGERFGSAWADSVSWTLLALGLGGLLFWRHRAARVSREERVSGGVEVAAEGAGSTSRDSVFTKSPEFS
jgi:hypothetical protein